MRKFSKIVSIALFATMILASLSGCGGSNTPNSGTKSDVSKEAKNSLKVAIVSEPPSLTTMDHDSLISVGMNLLTYNGLVRIDNKTLMPVMDLASEYSVENETKWIFKLKEGVTFHNGDPLTSADVKATIEYGKTVPGSALYTGSIESIETPDDYTVILNTAKPYAGLLYDLGYHYNFILPKNLIGTNDFNKNPIGTGPYKLKEWVYGDSVSFEANENYFDTEHKAKIPNLIFSVIPESASRAIALEAGEVDFVWDVSGADIARLEQDEKLNVLKVDTVDNVNLFLNNDVAPFDNADFRNAINYAINRQDIIDGALNGLGVPNYSCIPSGYWGSSAKDASSYNLDRAKEYLTKWGGDPASVTLPILCSNETRVAVGTILQSNLAKIGIKVDVVPMDTATYFAKWTSGDYVGVLASWSPSNALTYVQRFHSERRGGYPGSLNSPEVDALVREAPTIIDEEARRLKIEEIVSEVNRLSPQISLFQTVWVRAFDKNLQGVVCSGTGYTSYNDMYWAK